MELTERELRLIFKGLLAIDPGIGKDKEFTALLKRVGDEIMSLESARDVRADLRRRGYRTWAEWTELDRQRSRESVSFQGNR